MLSLLSLIINFLNSGEENINVACDHYVFKH